MRCIAREANRKWEEREGLKGRSEKDRKSKDWWVKGNNDNKVREWGKLKKEKE